MNPVKRAAWALMGRLGLQEIYTLSRDGLATYGWVRSARSGTSVDAAGEPVPWIAYPAIDLLGARIGGDVRVFEFGCGNSTLWWARRAASVHSVEHDRGWYDRMSKVVPDNVRLEFVPLEYGGKYSRQVQEGGPYDVVVVDGRDRVNGMRNAPGNLTPRGVVILDNSDRAEYAEGMQFLEASGFRRLPLRGLAPIVTYVTETSIFYRPDNVLGL